MGANLKRKTLRKLRLFTPEPEKELIRLRAKGHSYNVIRGAMCRELDAGQRNMKTLEEEIERIIKSRRTKPIRDGTLYGEIWNLVDGALRQTMHYHPEYFSKNASDLVIRRSINKRVAGAVTGFVAGRGVAVEATNEEPESYNSGQQV